MKKKIFSWLILACLVIPCISLLSACAKGDVVGYKVVINGKTFISSTNVGITSEYGETIDYAVYKVYENGEQDVADTSLYSITDEKQINKGTIISTLFALIVAVGFSLSI